MPVALAAGAGAVGAAVGVDDPRRASARAPLLAAAGAAGLVVAGSCWPCCSTGARRWFVLLTIATLPFRIPVPTGNDDTANLLLPLYVVIAAGVLAHLWRVSRGGVGGRRCATTRGRGG